MSYIYMIVLYMSANKILGNYTTSLICTSYIYMIVLNMSANTI